MLKNYLNENCILLRPEVDDKFKLLGNMSDLLMREGYVTEDFGQRVIEREKVFPTGLPMEKVGFAIPHADVKYVKKSGLCIAILDKPISFFRMDDNNVAIDIDFVVMIAMKNPDEQLKTLQSLIDSFNNIEGWLELRRVSRVQEAIERLKELFKSFSPN
ncbi:PTS sugar transporter subunit IIA [Tepidimicrobium xylanilyticum]|uniref:PTS system, galactitol-specific IIA component n=1 Tax=Tepidimicrobium xylanilyticum TaxID=1123352 RepID=A0A1H3FFH3_9FIRM|nr:PTS sugar transporter subunit IIA [Tepidimicrobium xylanilyticum]SDX88869.1 PTS system, galactitol-specific IIA component [Tepidimicrobium xylanilyticum]